MPQERNYKTDKYQYLKITPPPKIKIPNIYNRKGIGGLDFNKSVNQGFVVLKGNRIFAIPKKGRIVSCAEIKLQAYKFKFEENMKKILVSTASVLLICGGLFAQPKPTAVPTNAADNGIRRTSTTPVAPATILLLSLAGGFVGGKVCKNAFSSKKQ